jgi:hypothetical protein
MGIEPTFLAWEATFLPLEDTRVGRNYKAPRSRPAWFVIPDRAMREVIRNPF